MHTAKEFLRKFPILFSIAKWAYSYVVAIIAFFKWRKLIKQTNIKLELGGGPKRGENGWTNIDLRGADINCNLSGGIPLPNESVDAIYTSHMLEHLRYKSLIHLLQECYRVLKKGGYISVCVPNGELYIRAYIEKRQFEEKSTMYDEAIVDTGSYLDQVNYIAYMDDGHYYLFDKENLVNTLKKGGFVNAKLREFDPTLDSQKFDHLSIYAIAVK